MNKDGSISKRVISIDCIFGLRPAFWLKLNEKNNWNEFNPIVHQYYMTTHWNKDDSPKYGGIKFKE